MYSRDTQAGGAAAILDSHKLVRHFLFEGSIDQLLEIGRHLDEHEANELAALAADMSDDAIAAWATWLMQVEPAEGARIVREHLLGEAQ